MAAGLTPGNYHDMRVAEDLLHEAIGRSYRSHSSVPQAIIGDRGYDAASMIAGFTAAGLEVVIPSRRNRREQRIIDKERYRNRNQVERFFNRIKHCRRVATRYEKTARNYLAMVLLAALIM